MARASICWCLKVHHGQSRCEYFWTCCVETCCFLIEMPFCAEHVHDSEGIFCVEDGFGFGSFFGLKWSPAEYGDPEKFECEEDNWQGVAFWCWVPMWFFLACMFWKDKTVPRDLLAGGLPTVFHVHMRAYYIFLYLFDLPHLIFKTHYIFPFSLLRLCLSARLLRKTPNPKG